MWVLGLASTAALGLTILSRVAVVVSLRRSRALPSELPLPGVSVLRPVCGADRDLEENLRAMAQQRYPRFEILVGARDPHDPALVAVRAVQRDFPDLVRVFTGAPRLGHNPKVSNLAYLSRFARFDVHLISDADTRPPPTYLQAMAAELMQPGVELVHSHIVGQGEETLGARLDTLQLAGFVASGVALAKWVAGTSCVVGKSMMYRSSVLRSLGGFSRVKDVLAEDYVLGRRFERAGHRVRLSSLVLPTVRSEISVTSYLRRHTRWAQMRRSISPAAYALELLTNPLPWMLASVLCAHRAALSSTTFTLLCGLAALMMLVKYGADLFVLRLLRGGIELPHVLLLPLHELLLPWIFCVGLVARRVEWRGTKLTLGTGSVLRARGDALRPLVTLPAPREELAI